MLRFRSRIRAGGPDVRNGGFSPGILFAFSEPGVFLDPSDTATLFQDTAGTTPVTTPGQSVALALDKSRGLALGLELVTNGNFSAGTTGWTDNSTAPATFTAPSGAGLLTADGVARARARTSFTTVVGRTYRISYTASASVDYAVGTSPAAGDLAAGASASLSILFVATTTTTHVQISTVTNGVTSFGNISARELPGNHATQATAGSRPLYALLPANGVRNLANGSADPANNTYWNASQVSASGVTITRIATGVDGSGLPYADYTVVGTATASNVLYPTAISALRVAAAVGQQFTASFLAQVISGTAPTGQSGVRAEIIGETSVPAQNEAFNSAVQNAASETTVTVTGTLAVAGSVFARPQVGIRTENGATVNYTVRIKALQFELGSTRTAYQFNYSDVNIAQPPFAQVGALLFDGVDDFLQTPSVDFAGGGISGSNILTGTWSLTVDGGTATATESPAGTLNLTGDGTNGANANQSVATQVGRTYRIDFTVGSSANTISAGTSAFATDLIPTTVMNVGGNCVYFTATTTTSFILFRKAGAALSTTSGITVREAIRPADKMTVFAGARKLRDTAQAAVVSVGNLPDTVNGSLSLRAPALALNNYALRSRGTATAPATSGAFPAPDTAVLAGLADISGDAATLRRNGTQISSSSADQGTGNFGNHSIYIGQDGTGTALPFNGYLHSLIVRGAATDTATIQLVERWVGQRTGVTI
jgi:hypothetical protein